MTNDEMRVAIAEACGWKLGPPLCNPKGEIVNAHYHEEWRLPDYCNDLNAMHEAENMLCQDEEDEDKWAETLCDVCSEYGDSLAGRAKAMHATAAQRAEAFLKTIGKWKE